MESKSQKPEQEKILKTVLKVVFAASICVTVFLLYSNLSQRPPSTALINELGTLLDDEEIIYSAINPYREIKEEATAPTAENTLTREIRPEFLALREQFENDGIVGRLWIEGTSIDYIVVQSSDNDFYLHHDIYKNQSGAGWIFLDYEVDLTKDNQNTVIYGHNMRNGTMFGGLSRFAGYDFFKEHQIINFSTLYEDTAWEVFAFYTTHIDFPYTHINFASRDQWVLMLESFIDRSVHEADHKPTATDRILTLSTCENNDNDLRLVVQARLIATN